MEIILQWLDEIDDLFCAGFFLWHRLCRSSLALGLVAAMGLPLFGPASLGVLWLAALSATAFVSVIAWSVAFVATVRPQLTAETV